MSESAADKTLEPTPKKKEDAARRGDVLRSRELVTAVGTATGAGMLILTAPPLIEGLARIAVAALRFDRGTLEAFRPEVLGGLAARTMLPPILAIGAATIIVTIAVQLAAGQGGFNPSAIAFKGARLDPVNGLRRIFGTQGLVELAKGLVKLALLGTIAWVWAAENLAAVLGLGRGTLSAQLGHAQVAAAGLAGALVAGLLLIAAIDHPVQAWQRNRRLRMSHQEMREEAKQAEGSPEMKAARRQRQRDLARGSIGKAMKEAQFVIVNPAHFAVALAYDPALAPAPVVLAKGRGETALAMREIAAEDGLPVLEYPALARAVYFTTRTRQMVREELYVAIAALVAFVMSLKRGEAPRLPEIEVPADLRFDAEGNRTPAPGGA
ncbi:flagellar biosynthesis protein FlhB [Erythrobacter sp. HL-111]|uniref:EscU/YscU/HrcU family type III secretion system export apparatus switch protein n=1 Tax=Erythrobacter sp. HL-111 TaxID=1798193 RepID=UPI0006D9EF5A|nr:EscU/YscU/HrcU family type III secretion system export apparatus switch protein [Erythrobacter sp. HL-111]KPP92591.1 MAG: flagellar biosynthetic protein FlhB [Erythrobacteraceae bacterium HL-111]SDS93504.1 flagellar biosynthetic protein FlhB [Erythrobacter sp. HL-111]